ncbi:MAG: tetratricopeptide repeat protein [Paludibaculum sp.]
MDPDNPVVRLCVQGMEREFAGDFNGAAQAFQDAWDQSTDDFERCIAAHYVARHQPTPAACLMWNEKSLHHATAVDKDRVRDFYPSLYLNLGKSHEDLGHRDEARHFYELAAKLVDTLDQGRYGVVVRDAVARALLRVG